MVYVICTSRLRFCIHCDLVFFKYGTIHRILVGAPRLAHFNFCFDLLSVVVCINVGLARLGQSEKVFVVYINPRCSCVTS